MALEMQVLVELPVSRRRFVVEVVVGPGDEIEGAACFECEGGPCRAVRMRAMNVWRTLNKQRVSPSLLQWMDAVYEAQDRLGEGMPVCMTCWDEVTVPKLWHLAKMP